MEDSEMKNRAQRFLERLDSLGDVVDGVEYEIEEGLKMLGSGAVAAFVRNAAWAVYSLGQISGNLMNGATVRLPKAKKEASPSAAVPDDPRVISFRGATGGGEA